MNSSNIENEIDLARRQKVQSLIEQSRSYSGYSREAAVVDLWRYPSRESVEALIPRVNDWVNVIQERAKESLIRMLSERSAHHFIFHLDKIFHLLKCYRGDHRLFVEEIVNRLTAFTHQLEAGLNIDNPRSAVICAKLLVKQHAIHRTSLVALIQKSKYARVRIQGLRLLSKDPNAEELELVELFLNDKSSVIRRDALRIIVREKSDNAEALLKSFLLDKHAVVRSFVLFNLKKQNIDCTPFYIRHLSSEDAALQRIAIWGVTELFAKSALEKVKPLLESEYPSVRALAFRSCYVLMDNKELEGLYLKMLRDSSRRVIKECGQAYAKGSFILKPQYIEEILELHENPMNYRTILRMTNLQNKWNQLIQLSKLSANANPELTIEIKLVLRGWVNRMEFSFLAPTAAQISEIDNLSRDEKRNWFPALKNIVKHWVSLA